MNRLRLGLLSAGLPGVAAIYIAASFHLPSVGQYPGPYGPAVNALSVPERHITDAVTAVNFDIRAIDTLGEEFILFTSVMGAVLLLRMISDSKQSKQRDESPGREVPPPSDAVAAWALRMTGPTVILGLYLVAHGQTTPGGGFQGGVVLATAPLLIYLAENYEAFKRIASNHVVEIGEAIGAAGFGLIGLGGLLVGSVFLTNFLPLGQAGKLVSGGTVPCISFAVGLEVSGGLVLLLSAFLQEMLASQEGGQGGEG